MYGLLSGCYGNGWQVVALACDRDEVTSATLQPFPGGERGNVDSGVGVAGRSGVGGGVCQCLSLCLRLL